MVLTVSLEVAGSNASGKHYMMNLNVGPRVMDFIFDTYPFIPGTQNLAFLRTSKVRDVRRSLPLLKSPSTFAL